MKRGGVGDGISKSRYPAPTTRPRAGPIAPVIMIIPYLKVGAIAAQTPQPRLAVHPSVRLLTERVKEIARVSSRIHVVLIHGRVPGISRNREHEQLAARSPKKETFHDCLRSKPRNHRIKTHRYSFRTRFHKISRFVPSTGLSDIKSPSKRYRRSRTFE